MGFEIIMELNLTEQLSELLQNELVTRDCELFSIRVSRSGKRRVISLAIDHTEGGITLDECAAWNERLADLIETNGLVDGSYVVEVSSPGLDRPLVAERDFRRLLGKPIRIEYRGEDSRVHSVVRRVVNVGNGFVTVMDIEGGEESQMPLSTILKARADVGRSGS